MIAVIEGNKQKTKNKFRIGIYLTSRYVCNLSITIKPALNVFCCENLPKNGDSSNLHFYEE
jgi:hypothetical protein